MTTGFLNFFQTLRLNYPNHRLNLEVGEVSDIVFYRGKSQLFVIDGSSTRKT